MDRLTIVSEDGNVDSAPIAGEQPYDNRGSSTGQAAKTLSDRPDKYGARGAAMPTSSAPVLPVGEESATVTPAFVKANKVRSKKAAHFPPVDAAPSTPINKGMFIQTGSIFASPGSDIIGADFVIISYVSYSDPEDRSTADGRYPWARTAADARKIAAAYHYAKNEHSQLGVWLDTVSWDAVTGGVEQYDFSPMRTLGAIYKYAKYTLAIIENEDAAWLARLVRLWESAVEGSRSSAESFGAMSSTAVEMLDSFWKEVASNEYSYWNRAWILQEILQSNAILYCSWDGTTLRPLVQGSVLADMILAARQYRLSSNYRNQFGGLGHNVSNSALTKQETMWTYLEYSVPATVRAKIDINYEYQRDIWTAITHKTYYGTDRAAVLFAISIILGESVLPVESAVARAVHHAMIRHGSLPARTTQWRTQSQSFNNSSWASRYRIPPGARLCHDTAELQNYVSVPIPGELAADGRLGVTGNVVAATIAESRMKGNELFREVVLTDGTVLGDFPAVGFYLEIETVTSCWVLRTEVVSFFVCQRSLVLLGAVANRFSFFNMACLSELDWKTRMIYIK